MSLGIRLSALSMLFCLMLGASLADADIDMDVRTTRAQSSLLSGTEAKKILPAEWQKYRPDTLVRRDESLRRIRALGLRPAADQKAGRNRECSNQIFLEAKWRALYTADFAALDRRIGDLEKSLQTDDQNYATQQSAADGSWGACYEQTFMKVEASMLALQAMFDRQVSPKYAISFMPQLRSGSDVIAMLKPLLVSDIAKEGIDHRSELNALTTYAAQFGFKSYWQPYLEDRVQGLLRDRDPGGIDEIRTEMRTFLDSWQDPETGYWGAWYRINGGLYRTIDLSISFHLISYLKGQVNYWPQIIDTTLKIADEPYPYGWRYKGGLNTHNNYDVVKIFRFGWPHMTAGQRDRVRKVMGRMLDWTLAHSLRPDGSFKGDQDFFSSVASDYYFGVSFLDEIGYWRADNRFWTNDAWTGSRATCLRIRQHLASLQLDDSLILAARQKLDAGCGSPVGRN